MLPAKSQWVEVSVAPLATTHSDPFGGICVSNPDDHSLCGLSSPDSTRDKESLTKSKATAVAWSF